MARSAVTKSRRDILDVLLVEDPYRTLGLEPRGSPARQSDFFQKFATA